MENSREQENDFILDEFPHYDNEPNDVRDERAQRNVSLLLIGLVFLIWYLLK